MARVVLGCLGEPRLKTEEIVRYTKHHGKQMVDVEERAMILLESEPGV